MKIDLTELLQKVGNEADLEQAEKLRYPEDDFSLTKPAKIRLHLVSTGASVLVKGRVETEIELECSRCLKTFKYPLAVEIEEEFSRRPTEFKGGGETELKEADFIYPIEKDNSIDLTEVIRQNLLLAIPIKTLCSPDCTGIPTQTKGE
ncbi:MAG: DUF177 domain-containing protein [Candidatus Margulisiibacteriota bacterium]